MLYRKLVAFVLSILIVGQVFASLPKIGAQVFIEPGQTDEEIELWFKRLNEAGMNVCRIRMFEEYMRQANGTWDFTLFDKAFRAAEKYDVKVFATLFPSTPNNSIGGFKFPLSNNHQRQIEIYISKVVGHFKNHKSFYGWVLINEPGVSGAIPNTEYSRLKFEEWKEKQITPAYKSKNYTLLIDFDKEKFLTEYNTWYLNWLAKEVAKYDTSHEIHVNNHQIFENVAEYDFPAWRVFLTSLGASAHPSWHFGYFDRPGYTTALSANCNIIRTGAGNLPFWITELQGGNNTYSGYNPFCPTADEITQWLWTGVATGVEGIIFWSLNPRSLGEEAGEWALLDFQNNNSDRMIAATNMIKVMNRNRDIFDNVKPLDSGIHILYNKNSLWAEQKVNYNNSQLYEGRQPGGSMKSAIAYYEILCANGIVPTLEDFTHFDWSKQDYTGTSIILANVISLPSYYWENIRNFVQRGGKLFVDGLTGFYDENMLSLYNTGFPLEDVFGGTVREFKCIPGDFTIDAQGGMPVHLWKGYLLNKTGKVLFQEDNGITGIENRYGKGSVVWIPSMLGLGARRTGKAENLSELLISKINPSIKVQFAKYEKDIFMQTSQGREGMFSLVINKSKDRKTIVLKTEVKGGVIFAGKKGILNDSSELVINPEETIIIKWQ